MAQAAEAKPATSTLATSQALDNDSDENPDRPAKRARVDRKKETLDLTMRSHASLQAVLNTSELLEGILTFLPPKQLFADKRICKQWRDVIAGSPELQRKMFLRVDETPRQNWGLQIGFFTREPEVRRFEDSPLSRPWRRVTPVVLSPHLKVLNISDEGYLGDNAGEWVNVQPPCSIPMGGRLSILDTYPSNPLCYDFAMQLDFKFKPTIPRYDRLLVGYVQFKTGKALKLGEALDKAMAIRTSAKLHRDRRDKSVKSKRFWDISTIEVVNKLQHKHGCTAILCESSTIILNDMFNPNEQQWAEVQATYANMKQGME